MNLHKIALAGAVLAFASPLTAFAADSSATLNAALNALSSSDRAQVKNILSLEQTGQLGKEMAATQIDAVLSDSGAKAVLAVASKTNEAKAQDAGEFLASLAQPESSGK